MIAKFLVSNYLRTNKAQLPLAISIYFIIIILMVSVIMVVTGLSCVCAVPAPGRTMVVVRTPRLAVTMETLGVATASATPATVLLAASSDCSTASAGSATRMLEVLVRPFISANRGDWIS